MTKELFFVSHSESKCFMSFFISFVSRATCFGNNIVLCTSNERRGFFLYLKIIGVNRHLNVQGLSLFHCGLNPILVDFEA